MTSRWHEVVYTHVCERPRRGPLLHRKDASNLRTHVIQYDSPEHELANLGNPEVREHVCGWCDEPMTRLGAAAELAARGPDASSQRFLDERWWELQGA